MVREKKNNGYLSAGIGFSVFLHALLFCLFLGIWMQRPEPGGSGLVWDVFLTGGGDGFYQSGVPWGDLNYRPGEKGEKAVPEQVKEETPVVEKKTVEKKDNKKSDSLLVKKTIKNRKVVAKKLTQKTKSGSASGQGTGTQPYGGVVGDAPGFGAGLGTGVGIGSGAGIGDVKAARYFVRLRRLFQRRLKYPQSLESQKVSGRSVVRFTVLKDGKINPESVVLVTSSGNVQLDEQALKTVQDVPSLPQPPYGEMTIEIPVVFRVYH